MNKIIHGIVHGNTIELKENPGISDGQEVRVILSVAKKSRPWGEGIRNSAGALANESPEEDDNILEELHRQRKSDTGREIPTQF
jgi:hypothetical protein